MGAAALWQISARVGVQGVGWQGCRPVVRRDREPALDFADARVYVRRLSIGT